MAWRGVDSLVGHLDVRLHTAVGVHTAVAPVEVDTSLGLRALVRTRLTLVNVCARGEGLGPRYQATSSSCHPAHSTRATCTLAQARGQQLVALWTVAGEAAWLVDTAVLAEVTGVAALIDIWGRVGLRTGPGPAAQLSPTRARLEPGPRSGSAQGEAEERNPAVQQGTEGSGTDCPGDFPGGLVVKNQPANAGEHKFDPWSRNYDPTCPGATEPMFHVCPCTLEPVLCHKRSHHNEKPMHHNYRKSWQAIKTQCNQK